jgi:hypothetical protein
VPHCDNLGDGESGGGEPGRTAPVNETSPNTSMKVLVFAAVVEIGTGLALMIDPALVIALLVGESKSTEGTQLGRLAGVALTALGFACWPSRGAEKTAPAFRGMLFYNVLVALYLTYLGTLGHLSGLLLWPGIALHFVVALWLAWTWINGRWTQAPQK